MCDGVVWWWCDVWCGMVWWCDGVCVCDGVVVWWCDVVVVWWCGCGGVGVMVWSVVMVWCGVL